MAKREKAAPRTRQLTDKFCQRVRPLPARTDWPDQQVRGLRLQVTPSGTKTWIVRTRLHGKLIKHTIGRYGAFGLAEARDEARDVIAKVRKGIDPAAARRRADASTVEAVFEEWMLRDQAENRGTERVRKIFDGEVLPRIGKRPVSEITRADCRALVERIFDRGAPTYANRVHSHLGRMFRWAAGRDLVAANPMADLEKPARENSSDRHLDADELARVWIASGELGHPWDAVYRLLILTGCRLSEITELRVSEVSGDRIELPGSRVKNKRRFLMPLSGVALALLEGCPGARRDGIVFAGAANPSRAKRRIDALVAMTDASGRPLVKPAPIPAWDNHSLRHTVSTLANEHGLADPHVVEAYLNHVSGFKAGVAGRYNHAAYWDQKVQLAGRWESYVLGLVGCYAPRR